MRSGAEAHHARHIAPRRSYRDPLGGMVRSAAMTPACGTAWGFFFQAICGLNRPGVKHSGIKAVVRSRGGSCFSQHDLAAATRIFKPSVRCKALCKRGNRAASPFGFKRRHPQEGRGVPSVMCSRGGWFTSLCVRRRLPRSSPNQIFWTTSQTSGASHYNRSSPR